MSPVDLLKGLRAKTIHVNKAKESTDGKTLIGEFCDLDKREWNESYQEIIDQFLRTTDKIDE